MEETESLSYEDIGHLLHAKADKLISEDEDPEQVIHEIMETLGKARNVRPRHKRVNRDGRISFGRDLANTDGLGLFHADPQAQDEDGEGGAN